MEESGRRSVSGEKTKERRPKRANGEGGARQRANGSWEWRVTLEDRRRFSGYGKTQSGAKRSCLAMVALAEQGVDPKAARQTVATFLSWWLEDVIKPKVAPKTHRTYADLVRLHVAPALGGTEINRLTAQQVMGLMRKLEGAALSPRTVAHVRGVIRSALNHAVKLGVVARNVVDLTDPPRQVRAERHPFTAGEAKALLAAAEGDRLAAAWRLALTLGLRRGEILGLRWEDVDLGAATLRVARSLQRVDGVLAAKEPKTARSRRTLALPPSLVAALREHRDRQGLETKEAADRGRRWDGTGYVFVTPVGTPIDPDNFCKQFKNLLKAAELRDQRFHDLRHAAATLMIRDGLPVNEVSAVLGHSQTSTTLNIYSHVLPDAHERVAAAMERVLG